MTNLESIRRSLGLSQTKVAKDLGISRFWYWLIEKNGIYPSDEIKLKIESYFDNSIEFLLAEKIMKGE